MTVRSILTLLFLSAAVVADASIISFSVNAPGSADRVALVRSNSMNLIGQLAGTSDQWNTGPIDAADPNGMGVYGFLSTYQTAGGQTGVAIAVNQYEMADIAEGFPAPSVQSAFGVTPDQFVAQLTAFDHDALWFHWLDYPPAQIPYGQTGTVIYLGSDIPYGSFASSIVPEPSLMIFGAAALTVLSSWRRAPAFAPHL